MKEAILVICLTVLFPVSTAATTYQYDVIPDGRTDGFVGVFYHQGESVWQLMTLNTRSGTLVLDDIAQTLTLSFSMELIEPLISRTQYPKHVFEEGEFVQLSFSANPFFDNQTEPSMSSLFMNSPTSFVYRLASGSGMLTMPDGSSYGLVPNWRSPLAEWEWGFSQQISFLFEEGKLSAYFWQSYGPGVLDDPTLALVPLHLVTELPEPGTLALLLAALGAGMMRKGKRGSARSAGVVVFNPRSKSNSCAKEQVTQRS